MLSSDSEEVTVITQKDNKSTIWKTFQDKDPTRDFLRIVGSETIQSMLLDRNVLKKLVWEKVADDMRALGYDLGPDAGKACHQKWRNLKRSYFMYTSKPGHRDPRYIKELEKALETTRSLNMTIKSEPSGLESSYSSDIYEPSENDDSSVHSSSKSVNPSVHIPDVLAVIAKNNQERLQREQLLEVMFEERLRTVETMLQQQNKQLRDTQDIIFEIAKHLERKRKYS